MIRCFLLFVLILCSSCAQLSLFQDAKTLGKGNGALGGHLSGYGLIENNGNDNFILPSLVVHGTYGVTDKLDLQGSVALSGSLAISPKFQIIGSSESKWAFALNPGIELQASGFDGDQLALLRTHYSFITSIHPNKKLSLFLEPKYITQYRTDQANDIFYGSTIGVSYKVNERLDLSSGASFFDVQTSSELLYQLGFGLRVKFLRT